MKTKLTKILALLLVASMAVTAVACAENANDNGNEDDTSASETEAETEDEYADAKSIYNSLSADLEGEDFTIAAMEGIGNSENEIYQEAEVGEPIKDAVYTRNLKISEKFNTTVKIAPIAQASLASTVQKACTAGDESYKLVFPHLIDASSMSMQGVFLNYKDYEVLNINETWWDEGTAGLEIAGKVYFMSGDINYLDNDVTYILLFNKKLFSDNSLDEPYDLVRSGEWTIDVFQTMIKNVSSDSDGDGQFTDADTYGYVTTTDGPSTFLAGSGETYVSFDENGYPQLDVDAEKIQLILEKTVSILNDGNCSRIPSNVGTGKDMFMADRVLFYGEVLSYIVNVKDMETAFGVLPIPKYEASQDNYYTYCNNISSTCCIPTVLSNPEDVATVLEAMAIQSYINVTPAYYDISLQRKYTRDDDSAEMLDIALGHRRYDVGRVYSSIGLTDLFRDLAVKGSTDFASAMAKKEKSALKAIEKIVTAYEGLEV